MLDVLIVRIQPTDDFKPFNEELLNFEISISNDDPL